MTSSPSEQVLDALRRVRRSRTAATTSSASDMISGLVVKGGNVGFAIEVDPERGRKLEPLRKACEQAVAPCPACSPSRPC